MSDFISRAFGGRRRVPEELAERLPPGQYSESGFPVLTAGPTPRIDTDGWGFRVDGMVAEQREWTWDEFQQLPHEQVPCDIHCVTKWSKLGTSFDGVALDTLLALARPQGAYAMAFSYGGYTTNLALADLTGGKAWVVTEHEGEPLAREHGGPARLLVPQLYFWKSAKWLAGLRVMDHDEIGRLEPVELVGVEILDPGTQPRDRPDRPTRRRALGRPRRIGALRLWGVRPTSRRIGVLAAARPLPRSDGAAMVRR